MFDLFRKPLTVIRKESGKFTDGYWVEGDRQTIQINASIQAADSELLQTLPEGQRTRAVYTLITDAKLNVGIAGSVTSDVVVIDDERYQVVRVTPWQNLDHTKHYEVLVVRENVDRD